MDELLRQRERTSRLAPGDGRGALVHARALVLAGRRDEARGVLHDRLASRAIDTETLTALRELVLSHEALSTPAPPPDVPRTHVDLVVRRGLAETPGLAELAPTIAFTGLPQAEAWRSVQALLRMFMGSPPRSTSVRHMRTYLAYDEVVLDFRVPLLTPWLVAPGYFIREVRVLTLPGSPRAAKLRRRLLRSVSGVVFMAHPTSSDAAHLGAFRGLEADYRSVHGRGLDATPLLVQHPSDACACSLAVLRQKLMRARTGHLVGDVGWGPEALALLLWDVARGVPNLVRPRGPAQ